MGKLSTFQLLFLIGFTLVALVGALLFALGVNTEQKNAVGPVVVWGTLPQEVVDQVLESIRVADERFSEVVYVEKNPQTYDKEFTEALAADRGPDLFFLSEEDLYEQQEKILFIPYESFSQRAFKDTFAEAGEVYLAPTGIAGLPLLIDPLVMFWNRDIFADVAIAQPPRYWDEFFTMSPKVTQRDQSSDIVRSFVAFGEYRNINRAKDILATLILQTGNPIIFKSETGQVRSVLASSLDQVTSPAEAALRFYTEFSNPTKVVYSWNRALPDSRQSFLSGSLALYVDAASQYGSLKRANPNLNFDVMELPQSRDADRRITLGHTLALAIPRGTTNSVGAMETAFVFASSVHTAQLAGLMGLPPARRDLLSVSQRDAAQVIFYEAAIAARSWLDPNDAETEGIFQRMIESYLSGRLRLNETVQTASKELEQLLVE